LSPVAVLTEVAFYTSSDFWWFDEFSASEPIQMQLR